MPLEQVSILLIEDDPGHAELFRRSMLKSDVSHTLQIAPSLADALRLVQAHAFDVIFGDLSLPDSYGLRLVHKLRESVPTVPLIVLTSLADDQTALAALKCGAQDYIVKADAGIAWPQLRRAVYYAVQRQQAMNEKQALLIDLHEAKRLLERKNRRLRRLYRTAQDFVDHVSHEFRTPLSVIKEYASLIRDGVVGTVNEKQWQMLNVIDDRSDDLNTMVDDMLDVSKLKSGLLGACRQPCRIEEIVDRVMPALRRKAATRGVTLETDFPAELPSVYCDAEKAGRVIVNLVVNAIKFAGEPGRVILWTRANPHAGELTVGVTDNGMGIDPDSLGKIFAKFVQLDNPRRSSTKGFGLGLSIAKELVELNLGAISVESQPGAGSTFSFTLPLAVPHEVVDRYLQHLSPRRGEQPKVSLLLASPAQLIDDPLADDADCFLNHLLRRNDLLFRIDPRRWLLVLAAYAAELGQFLERVEQVRRDANRNRPLAPLPELHFQIDGTWPALDARDEVLDRVVHHCGRATTSVSSPVVEQPESEEVACV